MPPDKMAGQKNAGVKRMYKVSDMYDLQKTIAGPLLNAVEYPWQALPGIGDFIKELGKGLSGDEYDSPSPDVYISREAAVAPSAFITGPCIICPGAEVRHCAFIRGNAIVGENAVVGNSTELKNVILFDGVQVPHYNYVGDSILGHNAHMGAGAITSNVKSDKTLVVINDVGESIGTGLKKVGAMLGDFAEIGCNSVLNPGCVIGRNSSVYPLCSVRGLVPENSIYKSEGVIINKS